MSSSVLSVLVVASLALAAPSPRTVAQTGIQVLAAQRTEVLTSPFGEFTPTNKAVDVMLVVKVRGLSPAAFDSLPKDQRYVLAGQRKCELEYTLHFETGERELAFAVPRSAAELHLMLGDLPRIVVRPTAVIAKQLKSPLP